MSEVDILYRRCIEHWGEKAQIRQLIEEMAELTVALLHTERRSKSDESDPWQEIADVEIMLGQVRMIFDEIAPGTIDRWREKKINRLHKRLDDEQYRSEHESII